MGITGPSGAGKTMSALLTAKGLCGSWEKICVIDTENRSADLYEHLGDYQVIEFAPPFSPERFIEAIQAAVASGCEVLILDSTSAEWEGKGGIMSIMDSLTGNSFTNWGKVTPRHQAFIDAILQAPCHVICNFRSKTDYVLVEKNGKQVPEKVGMKAITREGWEYELSVVLDMDMKQNATANKDRTGLFTGKPSFMPSENTGKEILMWCETGIDAQEMKQKPFISDKQFEKLLDRVKGGDTAAADSAIATFSFTDAQRDTLMEALPAAVATTV